MNKTSCSRYLKVVLAVISFFAVFSLILPAQAAIICTLGKYQCNGDWLQRCEGYQYSTSTGDTYWMDYLDCKVLNNECRTDYPGTPNAVSFCRPTCNGQICPSGTTCATDQNNQKSCLDISNRCYTLNSKQCDYVGSVGYQGCLNTYKKDGYGSYIYTWTSKKCPDNPAYTNTSGSAQCNYINNQAYCLEYGLPNVDPLNIKSCSGSGTQCGDYPNNSWIYACKPRADIRLGSGWFYQKTCDTGCENGQCKTLTDRSLSISSPSPGATYNLPAGGQVDVTVSASDEDGVTGLELLGPEPSKYICNGTNCSGNSSYLQKVFTIKIAGAYTAKAYGKDGANPGLTKSTSVNFTVGTSCASECNPGNGSSGFDIKCTSSNSLTFYKCIQDPNGCGKWGSTLTTFNCAANTTCKSSGQGCSAVGECNTGGCETNACNHLSSTEKCGGKGVYNCNPANNTQVIGCIQDNSGCWRLNYSDYKNCFSGQFCDASLGGITDWSMLCKAPSCSETICSSAQDIICVRPDSSDNRYYQCQKDTITGCFKKSTAVSYCTYSDQVCETRSGGLGTCVKKGWVCSPSPCNSATNKVCDDPNINGSGNCYKCEQDASGCWKQGVVVSCVSGYELKPGALTCTKISSKKGITVGNCGLEGGKTSCPLNTTCIFTCSISNDSGFIMGASYAGGTSVTIIPKSPDLCSTGMYSSCSKSWNVSATKDGVYQVTISAWDNFYKFSESKTFSITFGSAKPPAVTPAVTNSPSTLDRVTYSSNGVVPVNSNKDFAPISLLSADVDIWMDVTVSDSDGVYFIMLKSPGVSSYVTCGDCRGSKGSCTQLCIIKKGSPSGTYELYYSGADPSKNKDNCSGNDFGWSDAYNTCYEKHYQKVNINFGASPTSVSGTPLAPGTPPAPGTKQNSPLTIDKITFNYEGQGIINTSPPDFKLTSPLPANTEIKMNVTIIDPDGLVYIMLEQPSGTGASVCGGRDCRGVKSCTRACTILASPAGDYKYKVLLAGLDNIPVCPPEQKNAKGECLEKVSKEISISLATPMTGCLLNDCTGKKEGFTICDASNNKNIITCGKDPETNCMVKFVGYCPAGKPICQKGDSVKGISAQCVAATAGPSIDGFKISNGNYCMAGQDCLIEFTAKAASGIQDMELAVPEDISGIAVVGESTTGSGSGKKEHTKRWKVNFPKNEAGVFTLIATVIDKQGNILDKPQKFPFYTCAPNEPSQCSTGVKKTCEEVTGEQSGITYWALRYENDSTCAPQQPVGQGSISQPEITIEEKPSGITLNPSQPTAGAPVNQVASRIQPLWTASLLGAFTGSQQLAQANSSKLIDVWITAKVKRSSDDINIQDFRFIVNGETTNVAASCSGKTCTAELKLISKIIPRGDMLHIKVTASGTGKNGQPITSPEATQDHTVGSGDTCSYGSQQCVSQTTYKVCDKRLDEGITYTWNAPKPCETKGQTCNFSTGECEIACKDDKDECQAGQKECGASALKYKIRECVKPDNSKNCWHWSDYRDCDPKNQEQICENNQCGGILTVKAEETNSTVNRISKFGVNAHDVFGVTGLKLSGGNGATISFDTNDCFDSKVDCSASVSVKADKVDVFEVQVTASGKKNFGELVDTLSATLQKYVAVNECEMGDKLCANVDAEGEEAREYSPCKSGKRNGLAYYYFDTKTKEKCPEGQVCKPIENSLNGAGECEGKNNDLTVSIYHSADSLSKNITGRVRVNKRANIKAEASDEDGMEVLKIFERLGSSDRMVRESWSEKKTIKILDYYFIPQSLGKYYFKAEAKSKNPEKTPPNDTETKTSETYIYADNCDKDQIQCLGDSKLDLKTNKTYQEQYKLCQQQKEGYLDWPKDPTGSCKCIKSSDGESDKCVDDSTVIEVKILPELNASKKVYLTDDNISAEIKVSDLDGIQNISFFNMRTFETRVFDCKMGKECSFTVVLGSKLTAGVYTFNFYSMARNSEKNKIENVTKTVSVSVNQCQDNQKLTSVNMASPSHCDVLYCKNYGNFWAWPLPGDKDYDSYSGTCERETASRDIVCQCRGEVTLKGGPPPLAPSNTEQQTTAQQRGGDAQNSGSGIEIKVELKLSPVGANSPNPIASRIQPLWTASLLSASGGKLAAVDTQTTDAVITITISNPNSLTSMSVWVKAVVSGPDKVIKHEKGKPTSELLTVACDPRADCKLEITVAGVLIGESIEVYVSPTGSGEKTKRSRTKVFVIQSLGSGGAVEQPIASSEIVTPSTPQPATGGTAQTTQPSAATPQPSGTAQQSPTNTTKTTCPVTMCGTDIKSAIPGACGINAGVPEGSCKACVLVNGCWQLENKISSCTSKYTTSAPAADGSVTCTLKADTQAQTQIQNQVPVSAPGSGAGAGAGTGATTNSKLIVYEPVFTDDKGNIFKIDDLPSNTNINMQVRAQDADGVDYIQVGSKYSADSEPYRYDKCGDSCAGASDCARVCKIDSVKTPKKVFLRIYVKSYGPKVGDNVSSESQSKDKELTFVETVGLTAPGIENSKNCGEQKVVLSEKPAFLTVDKGAYFTVVACGGNQGVHKIGVNVAGKLYETECNGEVWCKYQFAINIQPLSPGSIYTNVQAIAVIRTSPGGATTKTIYDSMMAINTVEGQPPELVPSLKIQSITIVNSAGKVVPGGGNRQQWNIWAKDPFSVQVVAIGEPKVTKMKGVWIKGVRIKESYSDKAYKPCGDACKGQDYCTRVCYVNPSNVQSGDEEQYEVYVEAEGENGRLEKQSYHFNVKYVPNPNSKASKLSIDPLIFTLVNEDYNTSKNQIFDITNLPSDTAINLKVTARDDDGIEYIQIEKVKDPGYVKCGEPCNKEIVCSRVCKIAPQKPGNIAFHLYIKSSNEVLGKEPKLTFVDYLAAARANKAPNSGTGQVKIDSIIYVPYINPQNSYTADFIDYIRNKGNIKYHPTALPLNTPLVARVTASDPDGVFYITMNSQRCGDPCYGDKTCFRDCYFVSSKKEESKVYEFEAAGAAYFDSFGAKPNTYVSDRRFGEIRDVSTGYYESLKQKQTLTSVASDKVIKEQVSCSPDPECAKGEVYKGETYYCNSLNICYWCSRDASIANSCLYLDKNAPFCNAGYTATRDSQGTVIACSLTPNTQNSGAVNNQGSCDTCSGAGQCNLATHACRKCVTDSSGCKNLESRASYCMPGYIQAPSLVPGGDITCK